MRLTLIFVVFVLFAMAASDLAAQRRTGSTRIGGGARTTPSKATPRPSPSRAKPRAAPPRRSTPTRVSPTPRRTSPRVQPRRTTPRSRTTRVTPTPRRVTPRTTSPSRRSTPNSRARTTPSPSRVSPMPTRRSTTPRSRTSPYRADPSPSRRSTSPRRATPVTPRFDAGRSARDSRATPRSSIRTTPRSGLRTSPGRGGRADEGFRAAGRGLTPSASSDARGGLSTRPLNGRSSVPSTTRPATGFTRRAAPRRLSAPKPVERRAPDYMRTTKPATEAGPKPLGRSVGSPITGSNPRPVLGEGTTTTPAGTPRPHVPRVGSNPVTNLEPGEARRGEGGRRGRGGRGGRRIYGDRHAYGHSRTALHYHVQGYGASTAVLWAGAYNLPHRFHYGYHGHHRHGYGHRGHYGHSWYGDRYGYGSRFGYFGKRWRFSVGFGRSYSPWHHRYHYPRYRSYRYHPYHYYSTLTYYPAYSTCYGYGSYVSYVDTHDPYVDFVDEAPVRVRREIEVVPASIPDVFSEPLVTDFPGGLDASELISRGQGYLENGEFLVAAEAFRRAWVQRPSDYFPAFELGFALVLNGDRDEMARLALHEGLHRNEAWAERTMDMRAKLPAGKDLDETINRLRRRLLKESGDQTSRFLLGYLQFFEENWFAAHSQFSILEESGYEGTYLAAFKAVAEARISPPKAR